jgi:hypothetical protein
MKHAKLILALGLIGSSLGLGTPSLLGAGADVVHSGLSTSPIANFGPVGLAPNEIYAYVLGSDTCNIGNTHLLWTDNGSPALSMNAFRLYNGRLQQIGVGMTKTACCVSNSPVCGATTCSGPSGSLMAGCRDTYSASWNSLQSNLKPRKNINPFTGVFTGTTGVSSANAINGRLQVKQSDMNPATYAGALFFVEGQYICSEDATNGNWTNNASYTRVTVNTAYQYAPTGTFNVGKPAIFAWREHGLGANVIDPAVSIETVDVPGEGRFLVASKVTPNGRNSWRYEYAIHNFNSDRAASSFRVPLPVGAAVSNAGFSDVWYHDDDAIYDGTDWNMSVSAYEQRWSCTQTVTQNPNANAIRWGTMYNFWFDCNRPPVNGTAEIDLFKAPVGCQPNSVSFQMRVPGAACEADVVRNGSVDTDDLITVMGAWGACACAANCPANIDKTNNNTTVDTDDLIRVITTWGSCP